MSNFKCPICEQNTVSEDEHHIIPREHGGEKGPTINVCPTCHTTAHRCVHNPVLKDQWLSSLRLRGRAIAERLIAAIKVAETSGVKSDTASITIKMPRKQYEKLKAFCKDHKTSPSKLILSFLSRTFNL